MSEIQYDNIQAKKLKEQIFSFMEDNLFTVMRIDIETIFFYNGLKISRVKNAYSIKDTLCYKEIDNLFLLKLILNHMHNAIKSKEVTETTEYNRQVG